ncbi:hypothetical protein DP939_15440 [Spongiactinospora rosea]|uniref:Uncharacterized protein n=1 Tax=Spongiactinospora rosea TaxID=2248750 RepID=A0A366LZG2_9ACTN|nr:hypothetical protein [Spongiactinospora rosea]RBQ19321.1 hypothetical protein DP939_15440 [Spongiactinospora rosea]
MVGTAISLALVFLMVPLALGAISLITLAVLAVLAKRTGGLERPQAPEPALIVLMFRSVFRAVFRAPGRLFRFGDRGGRGAAHPAPGASGTTRRARRDALPVTLSVPESRPSAEQGSEDAAKAGGRAEAELRPNGHGPSAGARAARPGKRVNGGSAGSAGSGRGRPRRSAGISPR